MILAAAQTKPFTQNTEANLQTHYRLCELAAVNGAQLIVFPEMSLTGYEREAAAALAFTPDDNRLEQLKALAVKHQLVIIAGAPININKQLYIGAFLLFPDNTVGIYTKQYLHTGEELYFEPGFEFNPHFVLGNEKVSVAICADITNPLHSEAAAKINTTLYIASIFYTPGGIAEGFAQLSSYAKKYRMQVLMANYGGHSGIPKAFGFEAAGKSAFWDNTGMCTGSMDATTEGLLLAVRNNNSWETKIVPG